MCVSVCIVVCVCDMSALFLVQDSTVTHPVCDQTGTLELTRTRHLGTYMHIQCTRASYQFWSPTDCNVASTICMRRSSFESLLLRVERRPRVVASARRDHAPIAQDVSKGERKAGVGRAEGEAAEK